MAKKALIAAALFAFGAQAPAVDAYFDWWWGNYDYIAESYDTPALTDNNGSRSHALCMCRGYEYSTIAYWTEDYDSVYVMEVIDGNAEPYGVRPDTLLKGRDPCVAHSPYAASPRQHVLYRRAGASQDARYCDTLLGADEPNHWARRTNIAGDLTDTHTGMATAVVSDSEWVYACYCSNPSTEGIWFVRSTDNGASWESEVQVVASASADQFSLAAWPDLYVYMACHFVSGGQDSVGFWRSSNAGSTWSRMTAWGDAFRPCVAVVSNRVFVCWQHSEYPEAEGQICCAWSEDRGTSWHAQERVEPYRNDVDYLYDAPTCHMLLDHHASRQRYNVVIVSELDADGDPFLSVTHGRWWDNGDMEWSPFGEHYLTDDQANMVEDNANPCVATIYNPNVGRDRARCVWANDVETHLLARHADWRPNYLVERPPARPDGTGRRLRVDTDGTAHYSEMVGANLHSGRVAEDGYLLPVLAGSGSSPALAVDGACACWTAHLRDDTVWCTIPGGMTAAVYCGSISSVPSQPSIEVYPSPVSSEYVANAVFAVYDTANDTSRVMYAKFNSDSLVLDTIETSGSLGDSCPCINVHNSDSLYVTWQHGDSVLSSYLLNYGPATWTKPGAWSAPAVVTADGYHPMSALDNDVLHCVYVERDTAPSPDTFYVQDATVDLGGGIFGNWSEGSSPGATADEATNPVYAGAGVTVWQQKTGTYWDIMAEVRGDTVTLVSSDTDSYHPHAVAESSAVSPSVNQVRVHLLWTAGVAFEVDSGVYDTGEVRYQVDSLNVSNAASAATRYNNGTKLMLEPGGDSLFAVYTDADGAVMYAFSASGDPWDREVIQDYYSKYPAIAQDSSGTRWILLVYDPPPQSPSITAGVLAFHTDGDSWVGPQRVHARPSKGSVGPVSLAAASDGSDPCAFATFLSTDSSGRTSVYLAKFDGDSVRTAVVASGSGLSAPAIAAEPVSGGDYLHLVWDDDTDIDYTMTDSVIDAGDWDRNLVLTCRSAIGLTEGSEVDHPVVATDGEEVIAAWTEAIEEATEIHACKRSTDSTYSDWEEA